MISSQGLTLTSISRGALLLGFFFTMVLIYEDYLGDIPYVSLFAGSLISLFLFISDLLLRKNSFDYKLATEAKIILLLIGLVNISWFYGVLIGLINGIRIENVFRNFFGLIVYAIFFHLFILRPRTRDVISVMILASLIQLTFAISSFDIHALESLSQGAGSISDARSSYSVGYLTIFPLLTASLSAAIFGAKKHHLSARLALFILFLICAFAVSVVTASKGCILALTLLLLFYFTKWISLMNSGFIIIVSLSTAFIFLILAAFDPSLMDLLLHSFTTQEAGNAIREEQAGELLNDMTLLGNGLGAGISSGYVRDEVGYGFELTYFNLVHKLGIFVLPIFCLYIYTIYVILLNAWKWPDQFLPNVAVGSLAFLVAGIGNPLLLGPSCVVMHCMALYLTIAHKNGERYD